MKTQLAYAGRGVLNLFAMLLVVDWLPDFVIGRGLGSFGWALLCILSVASYLAGVHWIERRRPTELLFRAGFGEVSAGFTLGIALFCTAMLLLWLFGAYHPSGWGALSPLASELLLIWLAGVIIEELLLRGFLFRLSAKLVGTWGALAITSALDGAAHAYGRGATVGSSIAVALEAGVLLGAAYALTQRLWLPMGLHLGWKFAQGLVFGSLVSGGTAERALIIDTLQGRALLTGGAFGPAASVIAVVICLAAAAYLLWRTVRLGRLEPAPWTQLAPTQHLQR